MSTLTMFLTWLLSLVGIQNCDGLTQNDDLHCIDETPRVIMQASASDQSELLFISNGL